MLMRHFMHLLLQQLGLAAAPAQPDAHDALLALRSLAFQMSPQELDLGPEKVPGPVWGALFETHDAGAPFSLLVLHDGTAHLYLSTGGGLIGSHGLSEVSQASQRFMTQANRLHHQARPSQDHPLPAAGMSSFYFLTYQGVLCYTAPEARLGDGHDQLSPLFHLARGVVAALESAHHHQSRHTPPAR